MTAPTLTHSQMIALKPCDVAAVEKLLGDGESWDGKPITAAEAVAAGVSFDDLVWVATAVSKKDKDIERMVRLWMTDCAARVLHIYEKYAPSDMRIRDCIIAARQYARGEISEAKLNAAWAAAWAAAEAAAGAAAETTTRAAAEAAAGAAARAAAEAAAGAAAKTTAGATAGAAAGAARAARAAEEEWQFARLVEWLSDKEPEDWPLPAVQIAEAAQ